MECTLLRDSSVEESSSCPVRPVAVVGPHIVSELMGSNRVAGAEAHCAKSAINKRPPDQCGLPVRLMQRAQVLQNACLPVM